MKTILELFADKSDLAFLMLVVAEIAVIGVVGLLAIRFARRDAATRYGIGLSALILMALCAPITWFLQQTAWSTVIWQRTITLQPEPSLPAGPAEPQPLPLWVWLWMVGMGAILVKVLAGVWKVHRERRRAVLVHRHGGVPVYATADVGPAVVGAIRPVILMPKKLLDTLGEEEVRDVLTHEFAHVAHRHLLVALFQRLLTCVLWPHPFVHLISRAVATAREEVCDNVVLRSAGATRYARVLLRVAECRQGPRQFSASMGLLSPPTQLEERVRGLLDPNRRIESTMNKSKFFLACLALALGTAAVAGARIQTHVLVAAAQDGPKPTAPKPAKVAKPIKVKVKAAKKAHLKKKQKAKAPAAAPALIPPVSPGGPGSPGALPPLAGAPGAPAARPGQGMPKGAPGVPPPARPDGMPGMPPGVAPAKMPPHTNPGGPGVPPTAKPGGLPAAVPPRGGAPVSAPPAKRGSGVPILSDVPIVGSHFTVSDQEVPAKLPPPKKGDPAPRELPVIVAASKAEGDPRPAEIRVGAANAQSKKGPVAVAAPSPIKKVVVSKKIKRAPKEVIVKAKLKKAK